jgi:CHAT domain-containing protein
VGLTRAFLHAGAANVVATLWPVDDWATASLMERFYEAYGGGAEPEQALAAAQRALLATPATRHPFFWAGFVAVGGADGEGRGP